MLEHSEQINEIAAALAKAQARFDKIVKDTDNPFFKSKYATLASIVDATRYGLTDNGIAVVQNVGFHEGLCSVTTMLIHSSGQWLKGIIDLPVSKLDPQGVGSASTYARRYGLAAFINVAADDDDDGNAASKEPAKSFIRPASGAGPASQAVSTTAPKGQPATSATKERIRVHQLLGDDQIICEPVAVEIKQKDGKNRAVVKLQKKLAGQVYLGCFDTKLFDALLACKDNECTLRYQVKGDFVNVVDVLQIGDRDYRDGKPYDEQAQDQPDYDSAIPF